MPFCRFICAWLSFFLVYEGYAQLDVSQHKIEWASTFKNFLPDTVQRIYFEGFVHHPSFDNLPVYTSVLTSFSDQSDAKIYIANTRVRLANKQESEYLKSYDSFIDEDFTLYWEKTEFRKKYQADIFILPVRKTISGQYELLAEFSLLTNTTSLQDFADVAPSPQKKSPKNSSIFSLATFYKMGVLQTGMYRLTYEDLVKAGVLSSPVPSSQIALFGNPAGMLSKDNRAVFYDDVTEIPISLNEREAGVFGPGSYLLFYGQASTVYTWDGSLSNPVFRHQINYYDNHTYYFLSADYTSGDRKRVQAVEQIRGDVEQTIDRFIDYQHYQKELSNPCNSGIIWMGEAFKENGSTEPFNFHFPDILLDSNCMTRVAVSAKSEGSFTFSYESFSTQIAIPAQSSSCLIPASKEFSFKLSSSLPRMQLRYNKTGNGEGYLNYMMFQYYRKLNVSQGQLSFRSIEAIGKTTEYKLNRYRPLTVWKVDSLWNIEEIKTKDDGTFTSFIREDSKLTEYIAFDGSAFFSPQSIVRIDTQNIHALSNIESVIVSHPDFKEQAEALAKMHQAKGLRTAMVLSDQVYNEFSSGIADPSSIRRMMKMLYDKAELEDQQARYLLLFGDASYDPKDLLKKKTNFISSFQSVQYWNPESIVTDDDFAYLGSDEYVTGDVMTGLLDIAVGRLPVSTVEQAQQLVEKIQNYASDSYIADKNTANKGDWRNVVCFSSDDGEGFDKAFETTGHFSNYIYTSLPSTNVEKVYSDAYQKQSTPKGASYPAAREALQQRINKGAFFVGYMGHGGWDAWSDEKILILDDIEKWKNKYALPMMFASACSFIPFDQVDRVSAGELCVTTPNGGAISMIAATRVAYSGSIEAIQSDFIIRALTKENGVVPRIGDAFLYAKNKNKGSYIRVFNLLGDPALETALPRYEVKTNTINEKQTDTLKALSTVKITGEIILPDGNIKDDFDGVLQVQVFDKMVERTTLGNQNSKGFQNEKVPFKIQQNVIYKGQTEVKQGRFSFTFVVPKDIAYDYGFGKISYYAYADSSGDAAGYFDKIVVGGFDENAPIGIQAPMVDLYVDNDYFQNGSVLGQNPILRADISDEYGLNTTGNGIGHDMILVLDGNVKERIVVNDQFRYDIGSYTKGTLSYDLQNLSPGMHTVELRVWNVFNLSTIASIYFEVEDPNHFKIHDLRNVPNPAITRTAFYFTHNSSTTLEKIVLEIAGIHGNLIYRKEEKVSESSYLIGPIEWNCATPNGQTLPQGMYIYTIKAYDAQGRMASSTKKMIIAT